MQAGNPLITRSIVIAAVLVVVGGIAYANSSELPATYATFDTGGLELTVDSKAFYDGAKYPSSTWTLKNLVPGTDKFFNFSDVKPGDIGSTTISIHVKKSAAWTCLDFSNFKDKENTITEPESHVDVNGSASGELGHEMEFFAWFDNGDGVFKPPEKPLFGTTTNAQSGIKTIDNVSYALADYTHGSAWADGSTHYIGIAWCAGDLSVNLSTGAISCSASTMGNEAQTDSLSTDIALRAVVSKDQPKFTCVAPPSSGGGNGGHDDGHGDDDHIGKKGDDRDHYVFHGFFDYGHSTCTPVGFKK